MSSTKISFLTNWEAIPYHAPLFLAKSLGYFIEEGIDVAILEPNDPSDVTELIGRGSIQLGFKAMVHCLFRAGAEAILFYSSFTLFYETTDSETFEKNLTKEKEKIKLK